MTTEWGTWTDLIESYRDDLSELNKRKRMYSTPLKVLQEKKKNKEHLTEAEFKQMSELKQEVRLISNMITSTTYALNWLMSGKCPDNVTSIENYSYDQRTIEIDPHLLASIYSTEDRLQQEVEEPDHQDLFMVESALSTLSSKEREAFVLFEGYQHTIGTIADMLNVKASTVNTLLRRARHKIKANKEADIFLVEVTL